MMKKKIYIILLLFTNIHLLYAQYNDEDTCSLRFQGGKKIENCHNIVKNEASSNRIFLMAEHYYSSSVSTKLYVVTDLPQIFDTDFQYFKPGSQRRFKRYFEKYGFTVKFAPRIYGNPYAQPPYYTEVIRGSDTLIYRESPSLSSEKTDYELFAAKFNNYFPPLNLFNAGKHIYALHQYYKIPDVSLIPDNYIFIHPTAGITNLKYIPPHALKRNPFCNVAIATIWSPCSDKEKRKYVNESDIDHIQSVFFCNIQYLDDKPLSIADIVCRDLSQDKKQFHTNKKIAKDSIVPNMILVDTWDTTSKNIHGNLLFPCDKNAHKSSKHNTILEICNKDTLFIISNNPKIFNPDLQYFPIGSYNKLKRFFSKYGYRIIFSNRMYDNEFDDIPVPTEITKEENFIVYEQPFNKQWRGLDTIQFLKGEDFMLGLAQFKTSFPPLKTLNIGKHIDEIFKVCNIPFVEFSGKCYVFIRPTELVSSWYLPLEVIKKCQKEPVGCSVVLVKVDNRGYIQYVEYTTAHIFYTASSGMGDDAVPYIPSWLQDEHNKIKKQ